MRLFKRGKYWWIDFSYRGKRYRYSLKTTRRDLAEKIRADIEVKLFKGEFFGIVEKDTTLRDFVENVYSNYMAAHKTQKTRETDRYRLKFLLPFFGSLKLSEITPQRVEIYKNARLQFVKPSTVNREIALLKAILNFAVKQGIIGVNPIKDVEKMKEPPGRVRYLKPEELAKLLKVSPPYLRAIIQVAVFTGLRKSDLLSLKWDNIDWKNNVIKVHVKKTNELRFIPMSDIVKEVLKNLPRDSEYVFTYRGKPIKDIKKSFRTACMKAGITDFRFHDLRHTFASYLVMNGVDLRTVAELMGHKTLRMVQRYSHLSPEHLKTAVEKIGTILTQKSVQEDQRASNIEQYQEKKETKE